MTNSEYLELFRINEGKYIIGIYQSGITVYKQQIRALNIFDALVKENIIKQGSNFDIAIIGGGVAGLTFAAAALKYNINVRIFEKEANFLHMQHGCDTRKIHPNIYDWPESDCFFPNARLPVLSWTYNTASNVTKQITKGLDLIKEEIRTSKKQNAFNLYSEFLSDVITSIHENDIGLSPKKFEIEHTHNGQNISYFCDLIIFAVGYGVETDLDKPHTPSYWRNDALDQSILDINKKNFLISGIGDGGLTDLFRLLIRDYSYDKIFNILRSNRNYNLLADELLKIKLKPQPNVDLGANYYYDAFKQLNPNLFRYIVEGLEKQLTDVRITLHSRKPFEKSLDYKKISLLNAFLAFILKINGKFTPVNGDLMFDEDQQEYSLNKKPLGLLDEYIIRHGTEKKKVTDQLFLTDDEKIRLLKIEKIQKSHVYNLENKPRWTFGEFSGHFYTSSKDPDNAVINSLKRREYLTEDTTSICLGYVSILSRILHSRHGQQHFRLSLHRITKIDSEFFFQQITPYIGSKLATGDGGVQHVHPLKHGLVGLAFKTGRPLRIIRDDEEEFEKLKKKIDLTKEYQKEKSPQTYFAIPILSPVKRPADGVTSYASNLVMYADSSEKDFFNKNENIEIVVNATIGFIEYINKLIESKKIIMCELEFEPVLIENTALLNCVDNNCIEDLSLKDSRFKPEATALKFKTFHSFDIIYNS